MIGASVCSGIGAPEVAAPWIDWAWHSEIEKFPATVFAHRHGGINRGDMTKFGEWNDAPIDILVGGNPCQSFSVAGLRKGLADPRGNLALTYLAIADRYRPDWLVWENVPGVLSSNGGRDFGAFLGGLGKLGYGFAWRVLDAQFARTRRFPWAVPQRRRRVILVGYLGDWRRAAAVLFDRESLQGNLAPRRQAGQMPAPTIRARPTGGGGLGTDFDCDGGLIPSHDPACTLTARERKGALPEADLSTVVAHTMRANHDASEDGIGRGTPLVPVAFAQNQRDEVRTMDVAGALSDGAHPPPIAFDCKGTEVQIVEDGPHPTLRSMGHHHAAVAQPFTITEGGRDGGSSLEYRDDGTSNAILTPSGGRSGMGVGAIAQPWAVRRLTPTECERLQGFPDGFTAIPWRGKPVDRCPDGPRYKALGNSMAVNVMEWVFDGISHVDGLISADMKNGTRPK